MTLKFTCLISHSCCCNPANCKSPTFSDLSLLYSSNVFLSLRSSFRRQTTFILTLLAEGNGLSFYLCSRNRVNWRWWKIWVEVTAIVHNTEASSFLEQIGPALSLWRTQKPQLLWQNLWASFFFFIPLFLSMCLSLPYCLALLLYSLFCADLKLFNLFKIENRSYSNLPRNVTTSKHNVQWGLVPKGPLKSMLWQAPSLCAQQSHSLLRMIKRPNVKKMVYYADRHHFLRFVIFYIFS